ncbi:malto-oligosyltrehalose trehalohydrolase [Brevibacterium daeguense]|uniref:Malto-oligosyltrehalose trehalohydrolase n=1 Tax=Brevibacterium daeguense TaxID=909936 RepID=A0ABP8EKJ2_9MICO|nr:malto-oligosyltrehalose trehalohydrolase [Brevibacterium daeguense]
MVRHPGIDTTFHFPEYPSTPRGNGQADGAVFHVWAPEAEQVALAWRPATGSYGTGFVTANYLEEPFQHAQLEAAGFRTEPAARLTGGWWAVRQTSAHLTEALAAESAVLEYGFLLDDNPALLPDPRSRRQPYGPHGPSATVLPASAPDSGADEPWSGRAWDSSPVYELHVGTFTSQGTFDAAIAHLDHLVGLGVGWVELLPVNTFAGLRNWGYDGVDWFAIQESYGGPDGYRRFIDAAHSRGLGVIQDVVYNHLGPSGNYLSAFGPYLHRAAANPWGDSMNLDGPHSDEVRALILDNLGMYVRDYGVDAFRLDAVHAFVDSRAVHLLEDMAIHMASLSEDRAHPVWLIAESDMNDPQLITSRTCGGHGLTAQWSDDFHHALHVALTGESSGYYADFAAPEALAKVLQHGFFHDGTYSSFRERAHGRPIDESRVRPDQLVVCTQNHDQVGNRAAGERLSQLVSTDRLAVGAALLMLGPNTPMIFMGEEWAASSPWQFFTDHREDWLGDAVSNGRRSEFARMGWDESTVPEPQDPATFFRSMLDWSEFQSGDRAAVLQLYRELGRLRSRRPEFRDIRFEDVSVGRAAAGHGDWIAVFVDTFGVVANLGSAAQAVLLPRSAERIVLDTSRFLLDHRAAEGDPDGRATDQPAEQTTRFRPAELRERAVVLQPMTAVALELADAPDEVEELTLPGR